MSDQHTYLIQLRGSVDVDELNARAPLRISGARAEAATTQVTVCSDQAGLIGLLRHLHGSGFQLLSITCESHQQEVTAQPTAALSFPRASSGNQDAVPAASLDARLRPFRAERGGAHGAALGHDG